MLGSMLVTACSTDSAVEQPMTRDRCDSQPGFVFVPAGEFIAGSDTVERDYGYEISAQAIASSPEAIAEAETGLRDRRWFEFEANRRTELLNAFCIQANLVTQQDYREFVAATGHRSPGISEAAYQEQGFLVHPYEDVVPYLWTNSSFPDGLANHPVVLVSYNDAVAYAEWRGQQDGVVYRLPTALEWEKTARGEDGRYFPWGNEWQDDATHWGQSDPFGTSVIARYPLSRSPYGAEDMSGNVFEFTSTLRERRGVPVSVMKGCSWDDLPGFCRAAYEHTRPTESRHILFGFRLVLLP
ncbi:SUMF1/EgtB/PvdO family nonheme iron enzyme [Oscillatoria sp. CS-180]|uniref:formylglycine-generating enzyme family protein n=1 Tax=Oscillatoria sp. CS-180 TaxID=3021720 RepID=UPI00232B327D|nr:SUMF1/EgtB/PvdO family nonheme iron enzyme [Oscillatoria sp. CS-180]MDB9526845.1 SUMF1/EgtB/PvdO family nonheme iron enzyme [Oscillatoria sp. CS-180]